jgi:glyceraldehyde 3-phosphate dehydrogenase
MVYLVAVTKKETTKDALNAMLKRAAEGPLKGILQYTEEELVSTDFRQNPHSSIVDAKLTGAQGDLIQLGLWYDNEWGYSCRLADVTQLVLSKMPA